ncbi:hypothetical protein GF382_01425 [Candidatus Falkowbacteria bacterium]|nr:hypothetical protein [Candidatus Falkowbacteria bacterium]
MEDKGETALAKSKNLAAKAGKEASNLFAFFAVLASGMATLSIVVALFGFPEFLASHLGVVVLLVSFSLIQSIFSKTGPKPAMRTMKWIVAITVIIYLGKTVYPHYTKFVSESENPIVVLTLGWTVDASAEMSKIGDNHYTNGKSRFGILNQDVKIAYVDNNGSLYQTNLKPTLKEGDQVLVMNPKAKPRIYEGLAFVEVKLADSVGQFLPGKNNGQKFWIRQDLTDEAGARELVQMEKRKELEEKEWEPEVPIILHTNSILGSIMKLIPYEKTYSLATWHNFNIIDKDVPFVFEFEDGRKVGSDRVIHEYVEFGSENFRIVDTEAEAIKVKVTRS